MPLRRRLFVLFRRLIPISNVESLEKFGFASGRETGKTMTTHIDPVLASYSDLTLKVVRTQSKKLSGEEAGRLKVEIR